MQKCNVCGGWCDPYVIGRLRLCEVCYAVEMEVESSREGKP